uniref:Zinc finger BED domain-containing protein RICESLEEPER 3 n=1 Tax=Tanacetum cinerariifolium TaxID=118510 RepID=A0A6L2N6Y3_TANCI|nr:zinc finger BED domain-containing protein RICESLEEPER 3 [Tanacetum cinerariifolium]
MPPIITCDATLNVCFNVNGVELLIESISTDLEFFDDSDATKAKKWFNDSLEGLYNNYYAKYGNLTTELSSGASSSRVSGGGESNDPLAKSVCVCNFWSLGFWKAKESMYLVLSRMAMDIISVQATSIASKSAFSTSGRVLSIRRTRLTLASLKMCMCLKNHLDAQERKQHKSDLENLIDFEEKILDVEVKEYQEKDKIGSKPDKNEKRGEARKIQKQLQWIKEEKLNKTEKEGPEMQTHAKSTKA